ncbi:hypothetical protein EJB05_39819, partial [Eragrostis curvula]
MSCWSRSSRSTVRTRRSLILCRMPTLSAAAPMASSTRTRMGQRQWQQCEETGASFSIAWILERE